VYRIDVPKRVKVHVMKVWACLVAGAGLLARLLPPLPLVTAMGINGERLGWVLSSMDALLALQLAYMAVQYTELDVAEKRALKLGTIQYGADFAGAISAERAAVDQLSV
jgi:hypothetical protein